MPQIAKGVYRVRERLMIQWCVRGQRFRETLPRGTTEKAAIRLRERKLLEGEDGRAPIPGRVTVGDLLDRLRQYHEANRLRGELKVKRLAAHFGATCDATTGVWRGGRRAVDVTHDALRRYVAERQGQGAADATIHNELAALRRAFTLAVQAGALATRPSFPMPAIRNAVRGFFTVADLDRLLAFLPTEVRPVVEFAAYTGWRREEVLGLTWDRVDFARGEVRVDLTKNGEPRVFPFAVLPRLGALLREQRARSTALAGPVFTRAGGGPVRDFRAAWDGAVAKLGKAFRQYDPRAGAMRERKPTFHGLRHTAAQWLADAGVDKETIMELCGWKTAAMFQRYTITTVEAGRKGVTKLAEHLAAERAKPRVVSLKVRAG